MAKVDHKGRERDPLLPDHLGGQLGGNILPTALQVLLEEFPEAKTLIDLGCGDGMAANQYAEKFGLEVYGVDGDWTKLPKEDNFILHDFSQGKLVFDPADTSFDITYSVEFLEHVEEEFQDNYMDLIARGTYAFVTAAPPGQVGWHHVNCRTREYWYEVFDKYGMDYCPELTKKAMAKSTNFNKHGKQKQDFFKISGMIFKKR